MIYFTADTHFFHNSIIGMCKRPFSDIEEMNRTLITNWNACIRDRDDVFILGDFAFKGNVDEVNGVLRKLNGRNRTEILYTVRNEDVHIAIMLFCRQ